MKRKIFFIITIVLVLMSFCIASYAKGEFKNDIDGDYNQFNQDYEFDDEKIIDKAGTILGYIQLVGAILSIIVVIVIGIKYMVGSVEQKAEYKKTLLTYVIGVVLLFSVTFLPGFIYSITNELINASNSSTTEEEVE